MATACGGLRDISHRNDKVANPDSGLDNLIKLVTQEGTFHDERVCRLEQITFKTSTRAWEINVLSILQVFVNVTISGIQPKIRQKLNEQ